MPEGFLCLRAVDYRHWVEQRPESIAADDAPACCLKDVCPSPGDNALSMYLIPADRVEELAPIIGAALAALRQNLAHAEFILFDSTYLTSQGLSVERLPGETPHEEVNRFHVDVKVSAKRAAALAAAIYGKADLRRVLSDKVKAHLLDAKREGKLDLARIQSANIRKALEAA